MNKLHQSACVTGRMIERNIFLHKNSRTGRNNTYHNPLYRNTSHHHALFFIIILLFFTFFPLRVMAFATPATATTLGTESIAIGEKASTFNRYATAIGYNAKAGAPDYPATANAYTVAIGTDANASLGGAIAIGYNASASNIYSTAIGFLASTTRDYEFSIARPGTPRFLSNLKAGELDYDAVNMAQFKTVAGTVSPGLIGSAALGPGSSASANYSTAIGNKAIAGDAYHKNATAIGANAEAQSESAEAIGAKAFTRHNYSTALGFQSTTTRDFEVNIGGSKDGTNVPYTRFLSGVRAGEADTDAVNMAQFKAIAGTATGEGTTAYGPGSSAFNRDSTAIGHNASAGATGNIEATAIGAYASVSGSGSTAIGYGAKAASLLSEAIGYGASAPNSYSTALGHNANTTRDYEVNIGGIDSFNTAFSRYLGGVRAGEADTDAVNMAQFKTIAGTATGIRSTAIGSNAIAGTMEATAIGFNTNASGSGSTAIGYGAKAASLLSEAIGYGASAPNSYSTALGHNANTTRDYEVNIGGIDIFNTAFSRYLGGVRAGEADTDAVNMAQFNQLKNTITEPPKLKLLESTVSQLQTTVNDNQISVTNALNSKASTDYVNTQLGTKADKTDLLTLATKASVDGLRLDLTSKLDSKADQQAMNDALADKASTGDLAALTVTVNNKAEQSSVNTLTTRVDTLEKNSVSSSTLDTRLAQTEAAAVSKANSFTQNALADKADNSAVSDLNSKIEALDTTAQGYANQAKTSAVADANQYTTQLYGQLLGVPDVGNIGDLPVDKLTLNALNARITNVENSAKGEAQAASGELFEKAKQYTDAQLGSKADISALHTLATTVQENDTKAQGYASTAQAKAQETAKQYTDEQINTLSTTVNSKAAQSALDSLSATVNSNDAKAQGYAREAQAGAEATAKTYTDTEIGKINAVVDRDKLQLDTLSATVSENDAKAKKYASDAESRANTYTSEQLSALDLDNRLAAKASTTELASLTATVSENDTKAQGYASDAESRANTYTGEQLSALDLDNRLAAKASTTELASLTAKVSKNDTKAQGYASDAESRANTYTSEQLSALDLDNRLAAKANTSALGDFYDKTEMDGKLALKASKEEVKMEIKNATLNVNGDVIDSATEAARQAAKEYAASHPGGLSEDQVHEVVKETAKHTTRQTTDYTDQQVKRTLHQANQYSEQSAQQALTQANDYSRHTAQQALTQANHYTRQTARQTLYQANQYTDQRVQALKKRMESAVAGTVAIASIPYSNADSFSVGIGVGNYQSGSAMALGAQARLNQSTNARLNISWDNNNNVSVGAGMSVGW